MFFSNAFRYICASLLLMPALCGQAQTADTVSWQPASQPDSIEVADDDDPIYGKHPRYLGPDSVRYAPGLVNDSLPNRPIVHQLHLVPRAYSNRVVLRWAPEGYPAWRIGLKYGYLVYRQNQKTGVRDTLSLAVKPLPDAKAFGDYFGMQDSLALAASELIYGKQPSFDGTMNFNQIVEEQQGIYSFALLIADRRPDLAQAMGLCFSDSTARPGVSYSYFVKPNKNDSSFWFKGIMESDIMLGQYKPAPYPYAPLDSVYAPADVQLTWPNIFYSGYDIERRHAGYGKWEKLNNKPYMTLSEIRDKDGNLINIFYDTKVPIGSWEYRIVGYDLFGERSEPGPATKVVMPDLVAPAIPAINWFGVDPTGSYMEIHFTKDTLESDLKGYMPMFYNKERYGDQWIDMCDKLFLPTDTMLTLSVADFPSGMITICAVDQSGNKSYAIPRSYSRPDHIPPSTPKNLRAAVDSQGLVVLMWSPSPEKDVQSYNIYYANDTTHHFIQLQKPFGNDTIAFDSLSLNVLQPFRYYKVDAWDYAGNGSDPSPWIKVHRPNYTFPQTCQLDSVWQDDSGLYSCWKPSPEPDIREFRILRRLKGQPWQLLGSLTPDSIKADGRLWVHDTPPVNRQSYYDYALESVNTTGATSGASLYARFKWTGPVHIPVECTLGANYREDDDNIVLAWEVKGLAPEYLHGAYFAIYYRIEGQPDFRLFRACSISDYKTTYKRIPRGKKVEFYMCFRNEYQQYGPYSDIVIVEVPEKKTENE